MANHAPAVREAYRSQAFDNQALWEALSAAAEEGRHYAIHPAWSDVQQTMPSVITRLYGAVVDGNYQPGETVSRILEEVDAEGQRALEAAGGAPEGFENPWPTSEGN